MTLLTTEIHVPGNMQKAIIIFAADRRISLKGKFHSLGKKVFRVRYLNAGIGFFGLAEVHPSGKKQPMSSWLPQFVTKHSNISTLRDFADSLRSELDIVVPNNIKTSNPSGFHIAGYNNQNFPEFWFVRNIQGMDAHRYVGFHDHYFVSEDFLIRDALQYGFDGETPMVPQPFARIYRNGDIRAHVVAWERLDGIISDFFSLPDFKKLKTIKDYEEFIKFKMTIIANIYKKYCSVSLIGTPIDVFSIVPK